MNAATAAQHDITQRAALSPTGLPVPPETDKIATMKRTLFPLALSLLLFLSAATTGFAAELHPFSEVTFHFADKAESSVLINTPDPYRKAMTPADRSYRMESADPVSQEDFDAFMAEQTLDWNAEEITRMESLLVSVRELFAPLAGARFPAEIVFVKTNGRDEADAACTRSTDLIFLSTAFLAEPDEDLKKTVIHELYHILTRNNPELQKELYALIGFSVTGELELPEEIAPYKITNPDAVSNTVMFTGTWRGQPQAWMPVLLVTEPYNPDRGGSFFRYIGLYFLAVIPEQGQSRMRYEKGKPVVVGMRQVPEYMKLLGRNTDYIIHPEEALAENFVLLITGQTEGIPNPEIPEGMKRILFTAEGTTP